ncbi:MAG: nicotinate-nucleotide adenylyltransferase [Chlorobi bacterium]|nr:nicotinate-nucleotide adenylyltransferase [Chlorobiota bacterium]
MKHTGLFFGSFNPVHIGHMAIANYMVEYTTLDQVWFVVSPHNPLKKKTSLLSDYHRLELVRLSLRDDPRFRVTNIEFKLPQPSYTIDTLTRLEEKYPTHNFSLIMGADNLITLHKWKNFEQILDRWSLIVYPRKGSDTADIPENLKSRLSPENYTLVRAPQIEISSTALRKAIREGRDMRFFFPEPVYQYVRDMHFYEK